MVTIRPGGTGKSGARHLAKAGAFAAEQRFVVAAAFFEKINPLVRLGLSRFVCFSHG